MPAEFQAFGESKTVEEWAADVRCRVPAHVLTRRMAMDWSVERAIDTPLGARGAALDRRRGAIAGAAGSPDGGAALHAAFGTCRTVAGWAEALGVTGAAVRSGIKAHGLEEYLRRRRWTSEADRGAKDP